MSKTKRVLSWCPNWRNRGQGGRWRKQIDGKMYYFGSGKSERDTKSYRSAEKKHFEFIARLEATKTVEVQCSEATVAEVCEKYMQNFEARYKRSEISAEYVEQTRCLLQNFNDHVGPRGVFRHLGEFDIDAFRTQTLSLPVSTYTQRPITISTARGRLKAVRALFRWAWKMRLIENLPRNIDDVARIPNGNRTEVKIYTVAELGTLWESAPSRTRCYMALALNCGYGQTDISDLRMGEVNWDEGYIERDRSKTRVRAKHKLWDVTLRLLKENCRREANDDERAFQNENGLPLVRTEIVGGSLKKSDAVSNAFFRVRQKAGINEGRSFYSLRKTGATLIERVDPAATEMYLAHAENGMKRAYAQRDWARLGKALAVLEKRLKAITKIM